MYRYNPNLYKLIPGPNAKVVYNEQEKSTSQAPPPRYPIDEKEKKQKARRIFRCNNEETDKSVKNTNNRMKKHENQKDNSSCREFPSPEIQKN